MSRNQPHAALVALLLILHLVPCASVHRSRSLAGFRKDVECALPSCPEGYVTNALAPVGADASCCDKAGAECDAAHTLNFPGAHEYNPDKTARIYPGGSSLVRNVLPELGEIDLKIRLLHTSATDEHGGVEVDDTGRIRLPIGTFAKLGLSLEDRHTLKPVNLDQPVFVGFQSGPWTELESLALGPDDDMRYRVVENSQVAIKLRPLEFGGGMKLWTSSFNDSDWIHRASLLIPPGKAEGLHVTLQTIASDIEPGARHWMHVLLSGSSPVACPEQARSMAPQPEAVEFGASDSVVEMGEGCVAERNLKFQPTSVVFSNIGGVGPDLRWPEALLFSNVFPLLNDVVDLRVTVSSDTKPLPMNGVQGSFAQIGVAGGNHVRLTFKLTLRGHQEEARSPVPFYLTFLAAARPMDKSGYGSTEDERILTTTACVDVPIALGQQTTSERRADGCFPLVTSDFSIAKVTPDPRVLSTSPDKAAAFLIPANVSVFDVNLFVLDGDVDHDFLIAGATNLTCPVPASCNTFSCPPGYRQRWEADDPFLCVGEACNDDDLKTCCEEDVTFEECRPGRSFNLEPGSLLRSNLGHMGPDEGEEGMMLGDVFAESGQVIDLHISALGEYEPMFPAMNGQHGPFLVFNVKCGQSVDFRFRFIDRNTSQVVAPPSFFLTAVGLGTQRGGNCAESVEVLGISALPLEQNTTKLDTTRSAVVATDYVHTNHTPAHPWALTKSTKRRTAVFPVANRSEVIVRLNTSDGSGSRNFRFASPSNAVCPARAACSAWECPEGFTKRRSLRPFAMCAGEQCGMEDLSTCCEAIRHRPCLPQMGFNIGMPGPNSFVFEQRGAMNFPAVLKRADGVAVDLAVTAPNTSLAASAAFGWGVLKLKLRPGVPTDVLLKFVARDGEAYNMQPYYFTIMDGGAEHELLHGTQVVTSIFDVASAHVARDSPLVIHPARINYTGVFRYSTVEFARSPELSRPGTHPMLVSGSRKRLVTVLTRGGSDFRISLLLLPGAKPESLWSREWAIYIAGPSNLVCPALANCGSFICPLGQSKRADAETLFCTDWECSNRDIPICCESITAADAKTFMKLSESQ